MNINLLEVICTSKDGDRFWRIPECYIRGNTIKYLRVPNEVIEKVQEEVIPKKPRVSDRGRGRGRGRGGLGGSRGGSTRGGAGGGRKKTDGKVNPTQA